MGRFAANRYMLAIRNGMISAMPFIIIGSFFLILIAPPLPEGNAIRVWLAQYSAQLNIPFRLTMSIMTLYVAFGIGSNLAKSYKLDALAGGQMALLALLMTNPPAFVDGMGWTIPIGNLGGAGMFVTLIVSCLAVEVLRFCVRYRITIRMPASVPDAISRAFATLFPAAILVLIMWTVTAILGVDLHAVMGRLFAPLVLAGDTLWGVLIIVFLVHLVWSFGIHGAIIVSVTRPFWFMYAEANAAALAAGEPLPYMAPETFYTWFVWFGGSGATLGLLLAVFLVGRSKYLKSMSKLAILPGLFNINEPVIFGMPIVLNPILIVPFILAPMAMAVVAWVATAAGIVGRTAAIAPWTLPAPLGAFISANGDWMAVVLVFVNLAVATLIYLPFIKIYDRRLLKQEQEGDEPVAV